MQKARIAVTPGDPSGIGPELIAKLLHAEGVNEAADVVLVGDTHVWQRGADQANVAIEFETVQRERLAGFSGVVHLNQETITPKEVEIATVTEAGGRCSLRCLDAAMDLAKAGVVDAILFAPFNKSSMTRAGLKFEDEHKYMADYLGFTDYHGEINVLDEMMTARVTSHIALKDVVQHIDQAGVHAAVRLIHETLKRMGVANPAIAVAALNPHAGDNGKFGREEIEILEPAVAALKELGLNVSGPWPSDTVFLKARDRLVDAVVTMYHDQGQIAIKLLGFERGVTLAGGLPYPIATPAHGTAFDIAGQNRANLGACRQAFDLLVRMANPAIAFDRVAAS